MRQYYKVAKLPRLHSKLQSSCLSLSYRHLPLPGSIKASFKNRQEEDDHFLSVSWVPATLLSHVSLLYLLILWIPCQKTLHLPSEGADPRGFMELSRPWLMQSPWPWGNEAFSGRPRAAGMLGAAGGARQGPFVKGAAIFKFSSSSLKEQSHQGII